MTRLRRPWLYAALAVALAGTCLAGGAYRTALVVALAAVLLALAGIRHPRRPEVAPMRPYVMPAQPAPPRRVRLHLFDGQYELLTGRLHLVELDLAGPGVDAALARHLSALTIQAYAAGEPVQYPRLEVRDPDTGVLLMDWTGA